MCASSSDLLGSETLGSVARGGEAQAERLLAEGASLRKVAAYDTALALPAHEFSIRDLPARAQGLIAHHDERLDEVRTAIGEVSSSASDISARVHWNTGPFEEFNIHTKRSALGETLSHLVVLADNGRARQVEDDGVVLWEQA